MSLTTPYLPALRLLTGGRRATPKASKLAHYLKDLRKSTTSQLESLFEDILPPNFFDLVSARLGKPTRNRKFPARVTFWAGIEQALRTKRDGGSLREALSQINGCRDEQGRGTISGNTGGLCKARQRLSHAYLEEAQERTVRYLEGAAERLDSLHGRPVKVVDATHVILSDTVENQRYFPQSENAKPGCGFPVARIMGLFSAQSGALLGHGVVGRDVAEIMAFEGEIVPLLQSDDILVADRQYSVYWIFGRMLEQGVDVVIRKNGSVKTLKTIRCLRARRDRLVLWSKPPRQPESLTEEEFASLPPTLTLRQVTVTIRNREGKKVRLQLLTTLLDPLAYPSESIARLYQLRWSIEVTFRDVKSTLGMERINAESYDVVTKIIAFYLIAHNLIRILMIKAARVHHLPLEAISFTGTLDSAKSYASHLYHNRMKPERIRQLYYALLEIIARHQIPRRPGRHEPRLVKHRRQKYSWLTSPRKRYYHPRKINVICA